MGESIGVAVHKDVSKDLAVAVSVDQATKNKNTSLDVALGASLKVSPARRPPPRARRGASAVQCWRGADAARAGGGSWTRTHRSRGRWTARA
jgi:hypothetical protein